MFFLLSVILFFASSSFEGEQREFCKIYGVMYETSDPREADFKVYEESSDAFAQIIVFEHSSRLYATSAGNWNFTPSKNLADYRLYFVENRREADFSVYFTEYESFAGCNE